MSAMAQAVSTALVDFVWQGALVGLLLWTALVALRHRSANARYAVSCAALLALVLLPVITGVALSLRAMPVEAGAASSGAPAGVRADMPRTMLPIWLVSDAPRVAWLAEVQEWALPIWSLGVLLFSVRLARGCTHSFALGRSGPAADESVLAAVAALAGRMGIDRPVRVLVSSLSDGPSVVGWLRPVILLPPATAMGLTSRQLEAVLAHELAHIRRHDYLVNMLQVVAETVFFYHPVVWWTSKHVRLERELCCDDLAVRSCGDPVCYARALTTLARLQLTATELAMAAAGGPLVYRIQRLVGTPARERGPSRWSGVIALTLVSACVVLNLDWLQAFAQPQASDLPQFEVASVKANKLNDGRIMIQSRGGRYTAIGTSLGVLIRSAYQVQEFQIVGGPSWLDSARFDIVAKEPDAPASSAAAGGPGSSRQQLMLRALLAERFKLTVHKETRDMPVYALVTARSDQRPGPQLRPAAVECDAPGAARGRGGNAPAATPTAPVCGTTVAPGIILAGSRTMAQLATALSTLSNTGMSLNRVVVDRTGLTGRFDFELRFTPDQIPNVSPGATLPGVPPVDPNGASIFTAVQEQLGLKLDSQRGPVEVLVIDRVEQPTED